MGTSEHCTGNPAGCNPFLMNCSILFTLHHHMLASEEAEVVFFINHLMGRECLWGTGECTIRTPACGFFQSFTVEISKVFGMGALGADNEQGLMNVRQRNQMVVDFFIDFCTKARQSDRNSATISCMGRLAMSRMSWSQKISLACCQIDQVGHQLGPSHPGITVRGMPGDISST